MPKTYAYIRISKDTSDAENQRHAIARHISPDEWISETVTGKRLADDRQLGALIEKLQPGDTLAVADVSRLGRRFLDVMETGSRIMRKKARLVFCDPPNELKDDPGSELYFVALSLGARIQRDFISISTKRALAAKKARGEQLGRPKGSTSTNPTLAAHAADIAAMRRNKVSAAAIARTFGVARDTVRKFLKEKGI